MSDISDDLKIKVLFSTGSSIIIGIISGIVTGIVMLMHIPFTNVIISLLWGLLSVVTGLGTMAIVFAILVSLLLRLTLTDEEKTELQEYNEE